jgi:hypothetical protein
VQKPLAAGHFATPGRRHDSTSEPAAAEFGGGGTCGGVPSVPANTNGQGVLVLPARQGSQTHPPTTSRDTGSSPPFRPRPRRPGRPATAFPRPHVPVHHNQQNIKVAGGHSAPVHHRRRLPQGPFRRLGLQIWSPGHHHIRQRGPIHVCPLGGPA